MADSEYSQLMSGPMKRGEGMQKPDWGRFGLSEEQQREAEPLEEQHEHDEVFDHHTDTAEKNELFAEDQSMRSKPWYKANFFISEPVLFGTWDGVFTSCMINIFGVVIFLRTGWMVGNAGIGFSVLIIFLTISVSMIAVLSAIGVCERCKIGSGGVYFLLQHVLGARVGASIGILYCFGQAVACSLYVVGFGESVAGLFGLQNVWISRGIGSGVVCLLLVINVCGVKWVIRLQLILLMVLFVAMLDFMVGSFVHTDPENGFMGYHSVILTNNTGPSYMDGESFFTVFGVFFPTATGVFAGINMSGDLRNPGKNIPVGTLSAVGVSTLLYLVFALILGATCMKSSLQMDYMIAEKVSIVGVLFLAGLYISSISSCMGALYGSPRIMQCIASENAIPIIKVLGQGISILHLPWLVGLYQMSVASALCSITGAPDIIHAISRDAVIPNTSWLSKTPGSRGPNKVPVYALVVVTLIALLFVFIGQVNTLGPIVTMPFMLTYAAVDYAYFVLAMSADKRDAREARFQRGISSHGAAGGQHLAQSNGSVSPTGGVDSDGGVTTTGGGGGANYGAIAAKKSGSDLDSLFPERSRHKGPVARQDSLGSPTFVAEHGEEGKEERPTDTVDPRAETASVTGEVDDTANLIKKDPVAPKPANTQITKQPRSFYSVFCNRWLSLLGVLISIIIMFAIQWGYALANISVVLIIYIYIGQANPGVFPGIAEFSMWQWIRDGFRKCCKRGPEPPEQIVVTPNTPAMSTMAAQLTEDNEDFAGRGRYHQSEVVKGENFDDYADEDD